MRLEEWWSIEDERFPYNYIQNLIIEPPKIPERIEAKIEKQSPKIIQPDISTPSKKTLRTEKQVLNVTQDPPKAQKNLQKETSVVQKEILTDPKKSSGVQKVPKRAPVVQKEILAVQKETPAVQKETRAVRKETPAVQKETPTTQKDRPKSLEKVDFESLPKVNPRKFQIEEPKARKIAKADPLLNTSETKMSVFCPSKFCPFVSSSITELVEHITQAHSFTCTIPQCGYSTKCLCKLAEHVQASHSSYQPISLNTSRLLRKYLLPISTNVDISEQREYTNIEEEKEKEEEKSYSLLAKMKEVKKNDPSLVLSNSTKTRKF